MNSSLSRRENDFEPIRYEPRTAIPATLNSLIDTESGTAEKKTRLA
jgi:hypothetical protein